MVKEPASSGVTFCLLRAADRRHRPRTAGPIILRWNLDEAHIAFHHRRHDRHVDTRLNGREEREDDRCQRRVRLRFHAGRQLRAADRGARLQGLAARGESPAAFGRRGIPALGATPDSPRAAREIPQVRGDVSRLRRSRSTPRTFTPFCVGRCYERAAHVCRSQIRAAATARLEGCRG
jgi:hypothetical protein